MVAVKSLHLPFRAWLGITMLKASPSLTTHTFFVSKKGLLLKAVALSSELRGQYFKERIQTNLNSCANIRNNSQSSKYFFCGRGEIRTPDTVSRMADFKSAAVQPLGYSSYFENITNNYFSSTGCRASQRY